MTIFKDYDIRGIYGTELTDEFAEKLGYAIIKFTKAKKIVVGYDSRTSNLKVFSAFATGVTNSGTNIVHIGIVTKPLLNWISIKKDFDLGVIITASHNPKEYNGFNFMLKRRTLHYNNGLNKIEKLINEKFKNSKKKGEIISRDFISEYVKFLSSKLHKKDLDKLRIVGDASNGAAGEILKKFMEINNINCELLFTDPDGNFPCHNPNPLDDNALAVLRRKVVENKADFGFIVDPDSDRARFVDDKGNIVDNSYMQSLVIKDLLKKHKNSSIVIELSARKILSETIKRNKGKEVISKVGHPYIIDLMIQNKAIYGCEMSGHNFFKEMYNLDSGELMMIHVINMYLSQKKRISSLIKPLDKYIYLGELTYKLKFDADKVLLVDKVKEYFKKNRKKLSVKKNFELDGISIVAKDFWFNLRPSNTEPILRFRLEGKNRKKVEKIKKEVEKILLK
ncbi:TPA: phosphomannomutase/phosphoglucomutase [Candidatus Woesearchaeota archaeon]|nr:phosphomannomutase/phosphoglucomutase [Candidatus Woesearchaeota archaeon]